MPAPGRGASPRRSAPPARRTGRCRPRTCPGPDGRRIRSRRSFWSSWSKRFRVRPASRGAIAQGGGSDIERRFVRRAGGELGGRLLQREPRFEREDVGHGGHLGCLVPTPTRFRGFRVLRRGLDSLGRRVGHDICFYRDRDRHGLERQASPLWRRRRLRRLDRATEPQDDLLQPPVHVLDLVGKDGPRLPEAAKLLLGPPAAAIAAASASSLA